MGFTRAPKVISQFSEINSCHSIVILKRNVILPSRDMMYPAVLGNNWFGRNNNMSMAFSNHPHKNKPAQRWSSIIQV